MADLKVDFRDWLLKQGLTEKTKSGKLSTIYDYTITLDRVCKNEGHISWEELAVQIPWFFVFCGLFLLIVTAGKRDN